MKILFDLRMVQPQGGSKFHGGGKYGEIVFLHLIRYTTNISVVYSKSKWINPEILDAINKFNITVFDADITSLSKVLETDEFLLYSPIGTNEHRLLSNKHRVICTIHGLRMYEMPGDNYMLKYTLPQSIKSWMWTIGGMFVPHLVQKWARHRAVQNIVGSKMSIITVSNHSKYSILSAIPTLQEDDIKVYYSPSTVLEKNKMKAANPFRKYFLMVSGNRWLKNGYRAVRAFDELFSERGDLDFKVVITGTGKGVRYINNIKNKDKFILLDYVDNYELQNLYTHAYAFVYPSLNEGFGYPPIEAMSKSVPVISSSIASIPEVCGDAALYFNPYSIYEIKMRILQMLNVHIHDCYVNKSYERYLLISSKQKEDLDGLVSYLLEQANS